MSDGRGEGVVRRRPALAEMVEADLPAPPVTITPARRNHRGGLADRVRWTADLVRVLAPRELRTRYRQSVLDVAWALITPISVLIVYGVVLTQSFSVSGEGIPYLSMAWSGLVIWTFFATAMGGGAVSLIYSGDLITKVYFPKEAIPLSIVGASLVDLGIGLCTVVVLMVIQGIGFTWAALWGVLPLLVIIVWTSALTVVVGVVAAFVRDIPHLVQLILRVGFFATPVMYTAAALPKSLRWTVNVSPVAAAIEGFRESVLRGRVPDLEVLGIQLVLGAALLVASVLYTRSVESRLTDVI